MNDKIIINYLEELEDNIKNFKLQICLFKEYCKFLQEIYQKNLSINYLKYAHLLDDANVYEPCCKEEWLAYQYYKGNLKALIYKLENKKSK